MYRKYVVASYVPRYVVYVCNVCNVYGIRNTYFDNKIIMLSDALTSPFSFLFLPQKFVVLAPDLPRNLIHLLEMLPGKESSLVDHMRDLTQKFVDKGLMEFSFVHNLLWEYTQQIVKDVDVTAIAGKKSRIDDLVNQLVESGPKLMSTKPGAKAMCLIVTHAGVKERKRIMKTLKGHCLESLLHDSGEHTNMETVLQL